MGWREGMFFLIALCRQIWYDKHARHVNHRRVGNESLSVNGFKENINIVKINIPLREKKSYASSIFSPRGVRNPHMIFWMFYENDNWKMLKSIKENRNSFHPRSFIMTENFSPVFQWKLNWSLEIWGCDEWNEMMNSFFTKEK